MNTLFQLIALALALHQPQTDYDVRITCMNKDGRQIVFGWGYIPDEVFNKESLSALFDRCLPDPKASGQVFVTSDAALYGDRGGMIPLNLDEPDISPLEPHGACANLFQYDGNRFYECRDRDGTIDWVVVTGENLFHRRFGRSSVTLVGVFRSGDWQRGCGTMSTTASFVISDWESLDISHLRTITRFYNSVFSSTDYLTFYYYPNFEEAGHQRLFRFPTMQALAAGYGEKKDRATYVQFVGSLRKGRLDFYEKGNLVRRSPFEEK